MTHSVTPKVKDPHLLECVEQFLQQHHLLQSGRQGKATLLMAYSGGPDSTVLLHILSKLRSRYGFNLVAAYYEHGWKGFPSPELTRVQKNSQHFEIPLVNICSDRTVNHTEADARQARYKQLLNLAHDLGATCVITGHHADDQVETLLFRLFRGTSVDGLIGIQPIIHLHSLHPQPVPVVRPLLLCPRMELHTYIEQNGLRYTEDATNEDTTHRRNQIRAEVIPFLDKQFPNFKEALIRLSQVCADDSEILDDFVDSLWKRLSIHKTHGTEEKALPSLDTVRFNQLSTAYQRRLMKRFLVEHNVEPSFKLIERILNFLNQFHRTDKSPLMSLGTDPQGKPRFLTVHRHWLQVVSAVKISSKKLEQQAKLVHKEIPVLIPGEVSLSGVPWTLKVFELSEGEIEFLTESEQLPLDTESEDLQAKKTKLYVNLTEWTDKPLLLRNRRPGDRMVPFAEEEPIRLKAIFEACKFSEAQRNAQLMLAVEKDILWIPGILKSESLRLTENPTHVLSFEPLAEE